MGKRPNEPPPVDNIISDETGAFDLRFILWRHFCQQNGISVDTLPSQLDGEQKEKWEELRRAGCAGSDNPQITQITQIQNQASKPVWLSFFSFERSFESV